MTDGDYGVDFFMEWANITDPKMSLKGGDKMVDKDEDKSPRKQGSRLSGESKDQRERRLSQARDCSSRRRSTETIEDRERRLKDQRERMAHKRRSENEEERSIRLAKARERESLRRQNETLDKRERRLQYSREKAAIRRNEENPEERERRLDASRIRASQRRREKKSSKVDSSLSPSSESTLKQEPIESPPAPPPPPPPAQPMLPRSQRVTRQSVQDSYYTGIEHDIITATNSSKEAAAAVVVEEEEEEKQHRPYNNSNNYKDSCGGDGGDGGGGGGIVGNYFTKSGSGPISMSFVAPLSLETEPTCTGMMTSDLVRPTETHSHSLSSDGDEEGSREGGVGLLGGIGLGFLERRHNHPDFNMGDRRIVVVKNI